MSIITFPPPFDPETKANLTHHPEPTEDPEPHASCVSRTVNAFSKCLPGKEKSQYIPCLPYLLTLEPN